MQGEFTPDLSMYEVSRMSRESIYQVLFWEMTDLVQHLKDTHPNHNAIPQVDKCICMIIDARRLLMELDE